MRIIVVDNHPIVREGLYRVLSLEPGNEFAGEASTVNDALELIFKVKPELVVVGLRLKNEYGLDIVKKAKEKGIACKFMVFASHANYSDLQKAQEMGVDGFVLKEAMPDELLYAIRLISRGRKYYDPGIMELAIIGDEVDTDEKLTPREKDVLISLGDGLKNNEIAKKLFITEYTVKKHVSQVLNKLNLDHRTQAALYANNKRLVQYL